MKRVLIIGANSYLAKSFVKTFQNDFKITTIKRDEKLKDYFELKKEHFIGFDVVVNFAAIVHNKSATDKLHKRYNYKLVKYISILAKDAGVGQFVQLSTIAVYGDNSFIDAKITPFPTTPYGVYKLKADDFLMSIEDDDFAISIVRPPIVYGKDAPGNMSALLKLISIGIPLPLGYYKNQRSMLCVDNFNESLKRVVYQRAKGLFLLKDQVSPSIGELVKQIIDAQNRKTVIIQIPKVVADFFLKTDISTIDKIFGDLLIDDEETKKIIGEYQINSFRECIDKMV